MVLPKKISWDVQLFTSHNNNFVSLQNGFCNDRGQATEEMAPAIDEDRLKNK